MSANYSKWEKIKFTSSRKETQGRLWGIQGKEPAKHGLSFNCKVNWAASWGAVKDCIHQRSEAENYYKSRRETARSAKECFGFNCKEIWSAHKRDPEKRVSNNGPEQKKEVVSVKESTLRCNICNISCTGENSLVSHVNGRKHLSQIQLLSEQSFGGHVWPIFVVHITDTETVVLVMNVKMLT